MAAYFPGLTPSDLPDGEGWAVETVNCSTHNGTHLDAPYHFASTMDRGAPARKGTVIISLPERELRHGRSSVNFRVPPEQSAALVPYGSRTFLSVANWGAHGCSGGREGYVVAGPPMKLFEGAYLHGAINYGRTYDMTGDGQRFLMIKEPQATDASTVPPSLVIVQNWHEELKRLVPVKFCYRF